MIERIYDKAEGPLWYCNPELNKECKKTVCKYNLNAKEKLGKRVKVCYKYDNTRTHMGTIVRDDIEEPGETIIKLDNGRYIRAEECQYSILETMNDERKAIYEKIKDIFIEEAKVPLDMKKGKVLIIRVEILAYVAMLIKKLAELK